MQKIEFFVSERPERNFTLPYRKQHTELMYVKYVLVLKKISMELTYFLYCFGKLVTIQMSVTEQIHSSEIY